MPKKSKKNKTIKNKTIKNKTITQKVKSSGFDFSFTNVLKTAFAADIGFILANIVMGCISFICWGIGIAIFIHYNKKDETVDENYDKLTKTEKTRRFFDDLQPMQYLGIVFIIAGFIPLYNVIPYYICQICLDTNF
jgi:hypothetical protein